MQIKALNLSSSIILQNRNLKQSFPLTKSPSFLSLPWSHSSVCLPNLHILNVEYPPNRIVIPCTSRSHEENTKTVEGIGNDDSYLIPVCEQVEKKVTEVKKRTELANQSLWSQMKEIVMFSGPATGLWICAPLMRLISTAVVGQGSSTELAALGDDSLILL